MLNGIVHRDFTVLRHNLPRVTLPSGDSPPAAPAIFFCPIRSLAKPQASFSTTGSHHGQCARGLPRRAERGRPPVARTDSRHDPQISTSLRRCAVFFLAKIYENRADCRWKIANGMEAGDSGTHDATRPKGWFFHWDSLRRLEEK